MSFTYSIWIVKCLFVLIFRCHVLLLNTDILVVYQYKTPTKPFKRKIWLYEYADYKKLRQNLFNVNWDSFFLTDDIELITNDITNSSRFHIWSSFIFFIFVNDIVNEINTDIKLFADDTSLYLIVDNPNDTAFLLNQDLHQIQRWSEKWLVKFNPNKTETMVISSKRNKPYHLPLQMNDQD